MTRPTLPALALLAVLAGAAGTSLLSGATALAQAQAPAATTAPATGPAGSPQADGGASRWRPAFDPARHIEGRLAYIKAELKITPAQEAQWGKVAQVMRDNAATMKQTFEKLRASHGAPQSAADRLETRAELASARAGQLKQFADAFRPLYDSLSPEQKQAADELFQHHGRHGHRA